MQRVVLVLFYFVFTFSISAQLPVARDTITVIENNYVLKMPWANGINFANVSALDVNGDNVKDLVVYDKSNQYAIGRFKCFVNNSIAGSTNYKALMDASYYFPTVKNWAVFYDYNYDGLSDLFCSTDLGIKVFKNTSNSYLNFTLVKSLLYSNYNPTGSPQYFNLYASSAAVPGFSDIDNDGDLDILTFAPQGIFVEYHKNMSQEKYGHSDSLIFERASDCWGRVSENSCTVDLGLCTSGNATIIKNDVQKPYHAGSCLTCFDNDGDGDKDLIMGDVSCNYVQFVKNNGTPTAASFNDTTKLYPNYPNKNSTKQILLNNYPCTYWVDVNKDGKNDLLASPNTANSENYRSLWFYKNISTTNQANFQFVKDNFLQDEMIEVGQNSYPTLIDYNADGKKDLLIGTYGYYNINSLEAKLTLYENIGTVNQPVFKLISRDYGNLSNQFLSNVMPTVGDIDGDGDVDILIGTSTGQIHWLKNTAGAGNVCNFSIFINNPFSFTTNSGAASPQLFDLDGDSKLDLLIGTMNGKVAYYKNIGTLSNPSFSLITNTLGNIDVTVDPLLNGFSFASPYFYNDAGSIKVLIGSISGKIFQYSVPSNINAAFTLLNSSVNGYLEGPNSTIFYDDINNDGKRDLFIGNASGGLSFFSSASPYVGLNQLKPLDLAEVKMYPNPFHNEFNIELSQINFEEANVSICNFLGELVLREQITSNTKVLQVDGLPKGLYFVYISIMTNQEQKIIVKKLVKD